MEDYLNHIFKSERICEHLLGIKSVTGSKSINHSKFVDDTLLMVGASSITTRWFKRVLNNFLEALGGQTNCRKYHIYTWNISFRKQRLIGRIMGFQLEETLEEFKYLGIPIRLKSHSSQSWEGVISKFKGSCFAWWNRCINMVGCVWMIKAVLSALPLYRFWMVLSPQSILFVFVKEIHRFLWEGGKISISKFHMIKWGYYEAS